jgi:hypothetical protein
VPEEGQWENGDRKVTCGMRYGGTGALDSPLATTVDPALKGYTELAVGECVPEWEDLDGVTAVVPCTGPHAAEVVATFELPLGDAPWDYPGTESVGRQAHRGCEKRAAKALAGRSKPPEKLALAYLAPDEAAWDLQILSVLCVLKAADGTLDRPLMPR